MKTNPTTLLVLLLLVSSLHLQGQETETSLLTLDRIFNSNEFKGESQRPISWVEEDLLLIQQLNRKQNILNIFTYWPAD